MMKNRSGAALLEAVAALTLLFAAGTTLLTSALQTVHTLHGARAAEAQIGEASELLTRGIMMTTADLRSARTLTASSGHTLRVQPLSAVLFMLEVADSTGDTLLRTRVYRARD
jgi:hypothetical protein